MKTISALLFLFSLFVFYGCSNNPGPTDSSGLGGGIGGGGNGGGGGGTGNVTIEVDLFQENGQFLFGAKASVDITLTTFRIRQNQQGIDQTFNGDPNTVYSAGQWYQLVTVEQNILQAGQVWVFDFNGTIVQGNQTFNESVNFTLQ